jgi:Bacterial alpha-L-rhamnosidase 6 hairpin glycosidase domain
MAAAPPDDVWISRVDYAGRSATASSSAAGYILKTHGNQRDIPHQDSSSETASVLFDALFALAQAELVEARTHTISDSGFNNGQALPCECLQTGAKWTYVWTRDIAYATDLALFRFDPQRARNGLEFKLSSVRPAGIGNAGAKPAGNQASYVVQDTGSGGSWPVSTDRIVWLLGAQHLLNDAAFAEKVYKALTATLSQDRRYVFDAARGLYRGETSFLDWREQTYPRWTANNVVFIAESFALSTNVLYYDALQLAASMAQVRKDPAAALYRKEAAALKAAIDRQFWREDRGLYMSYIGGVNSPQRIDAYDLLGTSLAILSGVAPPERARRALANYPTWEPGSPVIWPERQDLRVYHNRAIWPFVSAYALKAARALDEPARIAHELRSIVREAALSRSNMENFELVTHPTHNENKMSPGPVVSSKRQLWSIAGYLDMVVEGVFGVTDSGAIEPKLPRELMPMLFGDRDEIELLLPDRHVTLIKPAHLADGDNLLVAATISGPQQDARVQLKGIHVEESPLPLDHPESAPLAPSKPEVERDGDKWRIRPSPGPTLQLYVNNNAPIALTGETAIPYRDEQQCVSLTARGRDGIESLPTEPVCVGASDSIAGDWPRAWTAPRDGHYLARLDYRNPHGPISTGITAAVKMLVVQCAGAPVQTAALVMPHTGAEHQSTGATFSARAGQHCKLSLDDGFNMSYLAHYANYTGGEGGSKGRLNDADVRALRIVPLAAVPADAAPIQHKTK